MMRKRKRGKEEGSKDAKLCDKNYAEEKSYPAMITMMT
jgi:hypothetical protein